MRNVRKGETSEFLLSRTKRRHSSGSPHRNTFWLPLLGWPRKTPQSDGLVSPDYSVFDCIWGCVDYLQDLFRSPVYVEQFALSSKGIGSGFNRLYTPDFGAIRIQAPPVNEQIQIAAVIRRFSQKVDKLIRAKRRVIELLNEQKHAIIHRAVTRGLDSNIRLQPSDIQWLGEIPQHWEVWQIGHFARIGNGSTPSRSKPAYWTENGYPWLNSSTVNNEVVTSSDQFVTALALKECHLPRVSPGSVLIAITGQGKTRGMSAMLQIEATINQHLAFVSPHSSIVTAEYLQIALTGAYPALRAISDDSGSTKGALTCADIRHFRIALPPICEQKRIIDHVREETRQAYTMISQTKREIDLLYEYRTRLIADVVTGKLDVRGVEMPEIEDEEAIEPLTDTEEEESEDSKELVATEVSEDAD